MPTNAEIVRRFIDRALNGPDISSCDEFFHRDVVEAVPFPGQGPGVEGIKDVLRQMHAAFPGMRWRVEEQISEGDGVMTRFEWTGTHRAEFLGVPPTGRDVRVWGVVIDRFDGGKIRHTRLIMDTLGMMMQLGAIPAPGG